MFYCNKSILIFFYNSLSLSLLENVKIPSHGQFHLKLGVRMSGEEVGGQLEDSHRLFIQFFIQNPVVHHNQASKLFKTCTDQQEFNKESYFSFLSTINDQLSLFDLSIRQLHCHVSGERYFILANLADDQVALQWGSDLKREEIFALKEMITLIATTKKCRISTIDLLNSRLVCKYVTEKNKIEKLIDKLLQQSWFTKSS